MHSISIAKIVVLGAWSTMSLMAPWQQQVQVQAQEFTGDGTGYVLSPPGAGNCNFMTWPEAAVDNYVAMNDEQYDNGHACGRCVEVHCADPQCTSTAKEVLYVMDRCPECKKGDLDIPPNVFKKITGSTPGRMKVAWKFIDCPLQGNLKICLKSGSNPFWTAIQPVNMIAGVQSVTINGKQPDMVPSAYYYKVETSGGMDLSSVKVGLTSVSGETLETTVSLAGTECATTSVQFAAGSGGAVGQTSTTISTTTTTTTTTAPPSPPPTTTAAPAPTTTAPVTTSPPTTAPVTTQPPTTRPVTTQPPTTAPVTTQPPTTSPPTTVPTTTKPSSSNPAATIGANIEWMDALMQSLTSGSKSNSTEAPTTEPVATARRTTSAPPPTTAAATPEPTPTNVSPAQDTATSPPSTASEIVTKSKGNSGTSPFFIALLGLVVVVGIALVVVAYRVKQKKLDDKRNDRLGTPMDFDNQHQLSTREAFANV